jgi:hypothetical protein
MKQTRRKEVPPDKRLGVLAMQFRGTKDETARQEIAKSYSAAIEELIKSKKWREIPPLEDQLPDDWMPVSFFAHWSLSPPTPQLRRRG